LEYYGETGKDDINGHKNTYDGADNLCDFVVDGKKKFDEASTKKEDCHVQQERHDFDEHADLKFLNAGEKECANSDAMYWGVRMPGELKVPADPLLHKRGTEAARETNGEAEEPKDIHVNGITTRFE